MWAGLVNIYIYDVCMCMCFVYRIHCSGFLLLCVLLLFFIWTSAFDHHGKSPLNRTCWTGLCLFTNTLKKIEINITGLHNLIWFDIILL